MGCRFAEGLPAELIACWVFHCLIVQLPQKNPMLTAS
jgi:hypothetical protein